MGQGGGCPLLTVRSHGGLALLREHSTHTHPHAQAHTCTHAPTCTCTHPHTPTRTYTHPHTQAHLFTHIPTRAYTHLHAPTHMHTRTRTHRRTRTHASSPGDRGSRLWHGEGSAKVSAGRLRPSSRSRSSVPNPQSLPIGPPLALRRLQVGRTPTAGQVGREI